MSKLSHRRARRLIQRQHLPSEEHEALAAHLGRCDACREYAAVHIYLSRHLHLEPVRTRPTPEFTAAVVGRIRGRRRRNMIMNPVRTVAAAAAVVAVVMIAWLLFRTPAEQSATPPPQAATTAAPTRTSRPTLTPLATRVQTIVSDVTTADELVGVWGFRLGSFARRFFKFNADGTMTVAATLSRERLDESPSLRGEFWFEEGRLYLVDTEETTGNECFEEPGVYEVVLLENGSIRFQLIEDDCERRVNEFARYDYERFELEE